MASLPNNPRRVVIVGNGSVEHFGAHLMAGAATAGIEATLVDTREAWSGNKWLDRAHFHLLRRRPTRLQSYSRRVVEICERLRPELLLATGIAPLSAAALREIARLGIPRANYLTDDPWNRVKSAGYFWNALKHYNVIFTPRRSNIDDLRGHGCTNVQFLWLAYNPAMHFTETFADDEERRRFACDIAFVGGGDQTRLALVVQLLRAGLDVKLYGGYWDRFRPTRPHYRGIAIARDLRLAVAGGFVNLCMGRAANRDGHAMRTFELPAMGACMVVEDSNEHRELFGPEGECVYYYREVQDIVRHVRALQREPAQAQRIARAAQQRVYAEDNTYAARLKTMLELTLQAG